MLREVLRLVVSPAGRLVVGGLLLLQGFRALAIDEYLSGGFSLLLGGVALLGLHPYFNKNSPALIDPESFSPADGDQKP